MLTECLETIENDQTVSEGTRKVQPSQDLRLPLALMCFLSHFFLIFYGDKGIVSEN